MGSTITLVTDSHTKPSTVGAGDVVSPHHARGCKHSYPPNGCGVPAALGSRDLTVAQSAENTSTWMYSDWYDSIGYTSSRP